MFSFLKKKDDTNIQPLDEDVYLVTQAVDTATLAEAQKQKDLEKLTKAEKKKEYKSDIAKSIRNPAIARAATALQIKNPFKGV